MAEEKKETDILFPKETADRLSRTIWKEMVEAARPTLEAIERAYQESSVEFARNGENHRKYKEEERDAKRKVGKRNPVFRAKGP